MLNKEALPLGYIEIFLSELDFYLYTFLHNRHFFNKFLMDKIRD